MAKKRPSKLAKIAPDNKTQNSSRERKTAVSRIDDHSRDQYNVKNIIRKNKQVKNKQTKARPAFVIITLYSHSIFFFLTFVGFGFFELSIFPCFSRAFEFFYPSEI